MLDAGDRLGRHIDGADRHVLQGARRILERRGVFHVTERGVGLRRASNGQVAAYRPSDTSGQAAQEARRPASRNGLDAPCDEGDRQRARSIPIPRQSLQATQTSGSSAAAHPQEPQRPYQRRAL